MPTLESQSSLTKRWVCLVLGLSAMCGACVGVGCCKRCYNMFPSYDMHGGEHVLIRLLFILGHLYLSGAWFGVPPTKNTETTFIS